PPCRTRACSCGRATPASTTRCGPPKAPGAKACASHRGRRSGRCTTRARGCASRSPASAPCAITACLRVRRSSRAPARALRRSERARHWAPPPSPRAPRGTFAARRLEFRLWRGAAMTRGAFEDLALGFLRPDPAGQPDPFPGLEVLVVFEEVGDLRELDLG